MLAPKSTKTLQQQIRDIERDSSSWRNATGSNSVANPYQGGESGDIKFTIRWPGNTRISPEPPAPPPAPPRVLDNSVKISTPVNVQINEEAMSPDMVANLMFENLGSQEIISVARNDIVNGQNVAYQPIKNLSDLARQYNPTNIISMSGTTQTYFDNFAIKLDLHIPNVGTGPNGEIIYIEESTGNLIINVSNMADHERVEVQVMSSGSHLDDTIY